jgi:hypothetical protein
MRLKRKKPKYPCTVCRSECGFETIQCDECNHWTHAGCVGMTEQQKTCFATSSLKFFCPNCALNRDEFNWIASLKRSVLITVFILKT